MAISGRDRGEWSHQFILDTIEKLDKREVLRGLEVAVVALFVLTIAVDARRKAARALLETPSKTRSNEPAIASSPPTKSHPTKPMTSAQTGGAGLAPLAQNPSTGITGLAQERAGPSTRPTYRIEPIIPSAPWNQLSQAVSTPAPALAASPPAQAQTHYEPSGSSVLVASSELAKPNRQTDAGMGILVLIPSAAKGASAGQDRKTVAVLPSKIEEPIKVKALRTSLKTDEPIKTEAPPAPPKTIETRLEDKETGGNMVQQPHEAIEDFRTARPMFDRVLSPEEKAAAIDSDYMDAMQRIEGIYDPTRIGPFGAALRMMIRPGTMSMNNVFGDSWSRAFLDPNVHYRVSYSAESWLRPQSHNCDDFWRFRPNYSPVALEKLAPEDCKRIRSKAVSATQLVSESNVVAAPLSVPVFAAPYPGGRMSHAELLAALRARIDAANEQLWYKRLSR